MSTTIAPFHVYLTQTFLIEASPAFDDARGAAEAIPDDLHMVRLERAVTLIDAAPVDAAGGALILIADPAIADVLAVEARFRSLELTDAGRHSAARGLDRLSTLLSKVSIALKLVPR